MTGPQVSYNCFMDSDIAGKRAAGKSPGKNKICQGLIISSFKEKTEIFYIKSIATPDFMGISAM